MERRQTSGRSPCESAIDVHRERVLDETAFDLYSIMAGKETNEVNRIYRRESAVLFALLFAVLVGCGKGESPQTLPSPQKEADVQEEAAQPDRM